MIPTHKTATKQKIAITTTTIIVATNATKQKIIATTLIKTKLTNVIVALGVGGAKIGQNKPFSNTKHHFASIYSKQTFTALYALI